VSAADQGCALLAGEPECRCAADVAVLNDHELAERATEKFLWQQRAHATGRRAAAKRGLDAMLDAVRYRGPSALVSELIRLGAMLRILGEDRSEVEEAGALLSELAEIAELDGDTRMLGEVAAMRAHRTIMFGQGENALADAASAFAILTDAPIPPAAEEARKLSRALNGLVLVLLKLGVHELADHVSQNAIIVAEAHGTDMERLVHQLNRIRLQLSWALRLERGGRLAAAATRFVGAAQTARTAGALWSKVHGRGPADGRAAAPDCSIIRSAYALARPGADHLAILDGVAETAHFTEDRIILAIATARCLLAAHRRADATAALQALRDELVADPTEPGLAIALHRELSRIDRGTDRTDALSRYSTALEEELWALRESRLTALRSHSEHHRLARVHGAVAAQALQDPLTGLPNRRALDLRLHEATTSGGSQPCAVALIDLDRFKAVNDARSHAAGDEVLRAVAACLRTALRAQDLVVRYGGDEFVVVMPTTTLPTALAALARATQAVAGLPIDVGAGVTMSVGVARVPLHSEPAVALGAADAAMYRAKRAGGNRVVGELPLAAAHRRQVPPRRSLVAVSNESTDAFRRIAPA
jgi:diguanylate cyclase (GGDEF)-like protein